MQIRTFLSELAPFIYKQAYACIFWGFFLSMLLLTKYYYPGDFPLHRYDFLFLSAIFFQIFLIITKLESWKEVGVIAVFHIVATGMELFKTAPDIGSWSYPEAYIIGILGVPLFTGFMYSAVGSYITRVWRIFAFRFEHYPRRAYTVLIAILIYINFFTHHYIYDFRYVLLIAILFAFGRTRIYFNPAKIYHSMNLVFGFSLVALFIWFAENIGTFTKTWIYPSSAYGWFVVSPEKILAWFLLMIISFVLVSFVHTPQSYKK